MTLPIAPDLRVYLAPDATDMRKSLRGLMAATREVLQEDPLPGHHFGFCNRRRTLIKLPLWDTIGFWVFSKRLELTRDLLERGGALQEVLRKFLTRFAYRVWKWTLGSEVANPGNHLPLIEVIAKRKAITEFGVQ